MPVLRSIGWNASVSALVQGSGGSFHGTTGSGGASDDGTIFKLTVGAAPDHRAFFAAEASLANGGYSLAFPTGNPSGYAS